MIGISRDGNHANMGRDQSSCVSPPVSVRGLQRQPRPWIGRAKPKKELDLSNRAKAPEIGYQGYGQRFVSESDRARRHEAPGALNLTDERCGDGSMRGDRRISETPHHLVQNRSGNARRDGPSLNPPADSRAAFAAAARPARRLAGRRRPAAVFG